MLGATGSRDYLTAGWWPSLSIGGVNTSSVPLTRRYEPKFLGPADLETPLAERQDARPRSRGNLNTDGDRSAFLKELWMSKEL